MPNKIAEITLVAPAVRTEWWMELYEAFTKTNDSKFKMIFVGQVQPNYTLPDNFKHIYSEAPPAACAEIAFRAVDTEYVMNLADDYDPRPGYLSENILDKLIEEHKRVEGLGVNHFMVGPSFCMMPEDKATDRHRKECGWKDFSIPVPLVWDNSNYKNTLLCLSPVTKISTYRFLGGVDRRFSMTCWDLDLQMRLYEKGGQIKVMGMKCDGEKWSADMESSEMVYVTERTIEDQASALTNVGRKSLSTLSGRDRRMLDSLWKGRFDQGITFEDGRYFIPRCARKSPPDLYDDAVSWKRKDHNKFFEI